MTVSFLRTFGEVSFKYKAFCSKGGGDFLAEGSRRGS